MTRNNADFAAGLFHGSPHPFQPGDIVEPRMSKGAFATSDLEIAENYANGRTKVYNAENGADEPPKIFKVEPVNAGSVNKDGKSNFSSVDGFRVVKQIK